MKFLLWICIAYLMISVLRAYSAPSLEDYGRLEQVGGVSISPNGEMISYRRTESDEKDIVIIYSLKEGKTKAAINVADVDPSYQYFVNDNYLVFVASQHVDWRHYKHDFDVSTAFSFSIDKNEINRLLVLGEPLTGGRILTLGQTGLGRILGRTADGESLFMPAFVADSRSDVSPRYSLLKVRVTGKGVPRVASRGTEDTRDYFLNDKGKVLARELLDQQKNVHSIQVKEGKKWRTLYSYESKIPTHNFIGLTADFSALVFMKNADSEKYFQINLKSGKIESIFAGGPKKNLDGIIRDHRGTVVGVRYGGVLNSYKMLDPKLDKRIQNILSTFEEHTVYLSDWTDDWKNIIVRVEGSQFAGDYFLFKEGESPRFLVSSRLGIKSEDINPQGRLTFKARDKRAIPTIITLPRASMGQLKNMPTVILPHGGPASQDKIGFDYQAQALASRGYLVIQPQFRGSTGFGREHYVAGVGQWGRGMQDDLTDAVNFFVKKGFTDPERVCIVGASYGGYAALAGAAFTPELYKCAVSVAGVSHLPKMIASERSRSGKQSWVIDYWNQSMLNSGYDEAALKKISPFFSAGNIKAPVLLVHGEDDTVVEYEQSQLMYKAIKKAGGNATLIKLKDDDHYLRDSETRIQALKAVVEFVDSNIGKKVSR